MIEMQLIDAISREILLEARLCEVIGTWIGNVDGCKVGCCVGRDVGRKAMDFVGLHVGVVVGREVGYLFGAEAELEEELVGTDEGETVGIEVGKEDVGGLGEGEGVGYAEGVVGLGWNVGSGMEGARVGARVGEEVKLIDVG